MSVQICHSYKLHQFLCWKPFTTAALHPEYFPSFYQDIQDLSSFSDRHSLGPHRPLCLQFREAPNKLLDFIVLTPFLQVRAKLQPKPLLLPLLTGCTWKITIPLHCPVQLQPFQASRSSEISLTTAVLSLIAALHSASYPSSLLAPWFPRGWKLTALFELLFNDCSVGTSCQHHTTLENSDYSVNSEVHMTPLSIKMSRISLGFTTPFEQGNV